MKNSISILATILAFSATLTVSLPASKHHPKNGTIDARDDYTPSAAAAQPSQTSVAAGPSPNAYSPQASGTPVAAGPSLGAYSPSLPSITPIAPSLPSITPGSMPYALPSVDFGNNHGKGHKGKGGDHQGSGDNNATGTEIPYASATTDLGSSPTDTTGTYGNGVVGGGLTPSYGAQGAQPTGGDSTPSVSAQGSQPSGSYGNGANGGNNNSPPANTPAANGGANIPAAAPAATPAASPASSPASY